jgi:hypothetical protein
MRVVVLFNIKQITNLKNENKPSLLRYLPTSPLCNSKNNKIKPLHNSIFKLHRNNYHKSLFKLPPLKWEISLFHHRSQSHSKYYLLQLRSRNASPQRSMTTDKTWSGQAVSLESKWVTSRNQEGSNLWLPIKLETREHTQNMLSLRKLSIWGTSQL